MKNILRKIRDSRFNYEPLVRVNIYKDKILSNFNYADKLVGDSVDVAPVLKSNAYGHGLIEVANIIKEVNPKFIVVDSFYEAQILRNEGSNVPLLIIGFTNINNILHCQLNDIIFLIADLEWLREVDAKIPTRSKFHLKVDTGMNRQGVELEQLPEVIDLIKSNSMIELEGLCSHLCDADGDDLNFTNNQINKWNKLVKRIRKVFPDLKYWHLGASTSISFREKIDANLMRLGIDLYNRKPVMDVKTIITSLRNVKKGEKIGYNCTFTAREDMRVATIPMGYFEGVDRRLSNTGFVKFNGIFCPIVGRVSMNITSIDVSNIDYVQVGDEVEVISANKDDKNSIENMAKLAETIPYVIMVNVERKLKRCVV